MKQIWKFSQYVQDWDNDIGDISHTFEQTIRASSFHKALKKFIELAEKNDIELKANFKFKEIEEYKFIIEA